jgi:hypothetical protein
MSGRPQLASAALLLLAALVGCDGASAAREPVRASAAPDPADSAAGGSRETGETSVAPPAANEPAPPAAASGGYVEATFDDVKFAMEKTERFERSMLTDKVRSLFGKSIRIRGYMYPTLRKRGLTQFVLVRDNMECCFGPGAALYDCILVTMAPGKTAEYSIRPIAVEGDFRLEELAGPDGRPLAIYQMIGDAVQ